jgi:hypothetical protein
MATTNGMTTAPTTSGFYNYPPQTQLPPSVSVVVNQPPQAAPYDQYATPTAYRPSTDAYIGDANVPTLENSQYAATQNGSRYNAPIVYPSMVPHYGQNGNGVGTDMGDPNLPHDPTESGSR